MYIRRDKTNANPNARVVYADPETEKMLAEAGFLRASGAPYYNYGGTFVDVIIYNDGTWEPEGGTGFLSDEWAKMRQFSGVRLEDFVSWLRQNYQFITEYCANLKPTDYREEETFVFVKVHKHFTPPFDREYAWFIQHFSLLGSDGVVPAVKDAIPREYWFIKGKYYQSTYGFTSAGVPNQFTLSQTPDLENEITDPYTISKIKEAFVRQVK